MGIKQSVKNKGIKLLISKGMSYDEAVWKVEKVCLEAEKELLERLEKLGEKE